jgi:DNA-binding NtrC family response regulator
LLFLPSFLVVSASFLKRRPRAADVTDMTSRDGAEAAWASLPTTAADVAADGGASLSEVAMTPMVPEPIVTLPVDLPTMLRQIENAYVNAALTRTQNNKKEAAKLLGMGRTTLVEKLRRRSAAQRAM